MNISMTLFVLLCLYLSFVNCFPDTRNPNLEYEIISGGPQAVSKATFVPITRKPLIINTPPPVPADSKTFALEPNSKTWTLLKKNDPTPAEGSLIWNQSNDKWLTQTPHKLS